MTNTTAVDLRLDRGSDGDERILLPRFIRANLECVLSVVELHPIDIALVPGSAPILVELSIHLVAPFSEDCGVYDLVLHTKSVYFPRNKYLGCLIVNTDYPINRLD